MAVAIEQEVMSGAAQSSIPTQEIDPKWPRILRISILASSLLAAIAGVVARPDAVTVMFLGYSIGLLAPLDAFPSAAVALAVFLGYNGLLLLGTRGTLLRNGSRWARNALRWAQLIGCLGFAVALVLAPSIFALFALTQGVVVVSATKTLSSMPRVAEKKTRRTGSLAMAAIVVFCLLIIAAIAAPCFLKSTSAANEASAAASLRTIATATVTYSDTYHQGFAGTLAQLGPVGSACGEASSSCADLIDSVLSSVGPAGASTKSGYRFIYMAPNASPTSENPNKTYSVVAIPVAPGSGGVSTFCVDQTNQVGRDPSGTTVAGGSAGCDFTKFLPL